MRVQDHIPTTNTIIPAKGSKDAKIMIIGECPRRGDREEREPFSGQAGRTYQSIIFRAGISWGECYLTNVIKEIPPSNSPDSFISITKKKINVKNDNYYKYLELLKEEISEINPNVIIAVGEVALYALTGKTGITSWRGSILESNLNYGYKVIPTIAPASTIRQYMYQYYIYSDLCRVKEEAEFSEIIRPEYNYIIDPTLETTLQYLEQCKKSSLVGFDIEVGGYKDGLSEVSCISFSKDEESVISITFTKAGKPRFSPANELQIWDSINEILTNPNIRKVAQNKFFDTHFLFRRYGIITENCEDTMIAQAILRPDFPKGLDFINSIYTKIGYYKADGKEFMGGRGNEENFWMYNAKDSMVLTVSFPQMEKDLKDRGLWETYVAQSSLVNGLVFMSEHGIKIDGDWLKNKDASSAKRLLEIEELLNELVGREINPRSSPQLKEYFYGKKSEGNLGLPPYKNRTTGRPTTDESALLKLAKPLKTRPAVPEARLLLEHRKLSKLKSTYYNMSYDEDQRVRSSMNPVGTKYGRLSSSENIFGTGTNLQNQPYAMKEAFLIDEGYIGYEIDLSQAENRIVAYVAPEPKLIEAFENKIDIHSRTASYIFKIPEEEISSEKGSAPEFGNGDQSQRYWGKKANHAFNYGQGAKAFSEQMLISISEARTIYHAYHNAYPGVFKYHNSVKQQLTEDRTLTNLFGRRYTFLDRKSYTLYNEAYSFIPQSSIADCINRWGINKIYPHMKDVVLLNQVHDSLVFEISRDLPYSRHAELIFEIRDSLTQELSWNGRKFSIPCDLKIMPVNLMKGRELKLEKDLWKEDLMQAISQEVRLQTPKQ